MSTFKRDSLPRQLPEFPAGPFENDFVQVTAPVPRRPACACGTRRAMRAIVRDIDRWDSKLGADIQYASMEKLSGSTTLQGDMMSHVVGIDCPFERINTVVPNHPGGADADLFPRRRRSRPVSGIRHCAALEASSPRRGASLAGLFSGRSHKFC